MFTMLSTQIFVQSYTWILFHPLFLLNLMFSMLRSKISCKYHIYAQCSLYEIPINRILHLNYHVTYTDFRSILYLDAFSVHLTIESHVTMLSTKILVQSHTWIHFEFTFLLNLMLLLLSTQILVQSYTWTHFQFTFLLNQMLLLLSTQILVQSYTWTHFQFTFRLNLMLPC